MGTLLYPTKYSYVDMQHNPDAIAAAMESLFSPSDVQAASDLRWCPIQYSIITDHDTYHFEIAGNTDPLFDFTGMEPMPAMAPACLSPREAHVMNLAKGTGDNSVCTFLHNSDKSTIPSRSIT